MPLTDAALSQRQGTQKPSKLAGSGHILALGVRPLPQAQDPGVPRKVIELQEPLSG